jgi:hypothetical protein
MDSKKKAVEVQHPLASWQSKCSFTVKQWIEEFKNAESVYHKLGLLQFGLDIETRFGGWDEIRKFYFAVAEGYAGDSLILKSPGEHSSLRETPFEGLKIVGGLSHVVARKAFDVVCLHILKNTEKDFFREPSWASFVQYEDMFDTLLHFFRLKGVPADTPRFVNLKYYGPKEKDREWYGNHTLIAVNFLKELVNLAWPPNGHRYQDYWGEDAVELFKRKRQKIIELMYGLNRISLLVPRAGDITTAQMNWLKNLAMRKNNGERYSSIEEAAYFGSEAARTWIMLNILLNERKRQNNICDAKRAAEEAQQQLKKLRA